MPFPLGRIYGNTVRGAAENGKISKVLGSQLMTAVAIIVVIALVILLLFWDYIYKQKHWGRYVLALGAIGGVIMAIAIVSSYVTRQQTESLFTGSTEKMIEDLKKYERTSDITPNPQLGGFTVPPPVPMSIGGNYNPANPTVVSIPSSFVSGIAQTNIAAPAVQPGPQYYQPQNSQPVPQHVPPQNLSQMQYQSAQSAPEPVQVVQIGNGPDDSRPACPIRQPAYPLEQ